MGRERVPAGPRLAGVHMASVPESTDSHERSGWEILTQDESRNRVNVRAVMETVRALTPGRESLDSFVTHVLERVIDVARAERALVVFPERDGRLAPRWGLDADGQSLGPSTAFSRSVCESVVRDREPTITLDTLQPPGPTSASIFDLELKSILAAPLLASGGEILAVLYADSRKSNHTFGTADEFVFQALAMILAMAIEREEHSRELAEAQRLQRDLAEAHSIQARLQPTTLPTVRGYEVAARARPFEETSGDYYDAIPLPDGRLALAIGDVSGHGLGACLYMLQARTRLRTDIERGETDPARLLSDLNAFLFEAMGDPEYMTMAVFILDPREGTISYASAGHPPALLVRPGAAEPERLGFTGPILGMFESVRWAEAGPVDMPEGSSLLLYTDGLFEAPGPGGTRWEEDRLVDSCMSHAQPDAGAEQILDCIFSDLDRHVGDHALEDDVTALVVRAV